MEEDLVFRYLRYLPIVLPFIIRFVRSRKAGPGGSPEGGGPRR